MLSLFPQLLFLSPLAPFLIRIALSITLGYSAYRHFQSEGIVSRTLAFFEVTAALMLFTGTWTQAGGLLAAIIAGIWFFQPSSRTLALGTILLSFVMSLCLLFTGGGAFAFDLPL